MPTYENPERDLLAKLRARLKGKDIGQYNLTHEKGKLLPQVAALRAQRSGNINPKPSGPGSTQIPPGVVPTKPMVPGVGGPAGGRPVGMAGDSLMTSPSPTQQPFTPRPGGTSTTGPGRRISGPLMAQANRSALPGRGQAKRNISLGDIQELKRRLKQGKRVV